MKSTIAPPTGHPPLRATVLLTSATLPAVALMAILPVAFGEGKFVVPPAPCASWMRKYCPGASEPLRAVTCHVAPAADAYCTDQPFRFTGAPSALKISIKSFLKVDPALPPPP